MTKKPKWKNEPVTEKIPRSETFPESSDSQIIAWHLNIVDRGGPWGWHEDLVSREHWDMILEKVKAFETMTWATIHSHGSHPIEVYKIIKDARKRLVEIGQEDAPALYSLRVRGKERIWGIRDRRVLKVLWWDPKHQICPSLK